MTGAIRDDVLLKCASFGQVRGAALGKSRKWDSHRAGAEDEVDEGTQMFLRHMAEGMNSGSNGTYDYVLLLWGARATF